MKNLLLSLGSLFFTACTSVPRICEPDQAREAGFGLAMQGKEIFYGQGDVCVDEHRPIFKQSFESGYQQVRLRNCDPQEVEHTAHQRGGNGEKTSFNKEDYKICDGTSEQAKAFKKGFSDGLAEFCQDSRAEAEGLSQGEAGAEKTFPPKYDLCAGKLGKLKGAFQKGYKEGNAKFCRADHANEEGLKDGGEGRDAANLEERFRACSAADRKRVVKQYLEGYNQALLQFCSVTNIEGAARSHAQKSSTANLPDNYRTCFAKFPELKTTYEKAFAEERDRVVQAQCTFQNGQEQGRSDARSSNQKNTSLPNYCNQQLFAVYLQGYLEGWKNGKYQLCNGDDAYQEGLRQGQSSSFTYSNYSAPSLCPEEYGAGMATRYREGYQFSQNQKMQSAAGFTSANCRTEVVNRSGTMDLSRCKNSSGRIACYSEIRETCAIPGSGEKKVRSYQQFDGRCVSSYSNCW